MPTKIGSQVGDPTKGRKAAYFARNRLEIIHSAQVVFSEFGPEATIEQVAKHAEVAMSTIYTHFVDKNDLIEAALVTSIANWEAWMTPRLSEISDPLVRFATAIRMFLRVRTTHPRYAKLGATNLAATNLYWSILMGSLQARLESLAQSGVIKVDNPEVRIRLLCAVIFETLKIQLLDPESKDANADLAIEVSLCLLGIKPTQAHNLMTALLPPYGLVTPAPF